MKIFKRYVGTKKLNYFVVSLFFVFCFLTFMSGCKEVKLYINKKIKLLINHNSEKSLKKPKKTVIPVEVARVSEKELQEILKFTGSIEGKDQVLVFSKVPGKLIEYKVQEGEHVKKDDIIALIDRDITGFKFEPAPVESPISGIVAKTYLDRGDSVNPRMPIAVIANTDEVKIKFEVTEIDYPKIKLGQIAKIKIDAYPDRIFEGEISKLSALINPNTRTATAEITISNPEHFLVPGMFARISLFVRKHKCLVVPRDAVLRLPGTGVYYCFKVENGKAKKTLIELGMKQKNDQEIKKGLKEGDLVILSGQGVLRTGLPVDIKNKVEGGVE